MKAAAISLLALCSLLTFVPAARSAVTVRVWDAAGDPGERTTVDLWVEGNTGEAIYGYLFDINYDPALMTFVGFTTSGTVSQGCGGASNVIVPGRARVAVACTNPFFESGPLCRVHFDVSPTAPLHTSTPLTLTRVLLNDGALAATTQAGVLSVGGTAAPATRDAATIILRSRNPLPVGLPCRWEVVGPAIGATLEVFDSRGRRVHRETVADSVDPRPLMWTPRDQDGRSLPAGTYYYRFGNGSRWLRGKVTFVR